MNPIPARLMQAQAEACPSRPAPTERERNRRAYILEAATRIFTTHGRLRVTLREIAVATGLTQIAIRNQIADIDHLFALTLAKHLQSIMSAIGAIQTTGPDLHARRRAEYLRVTRGFLNVPTPLHFLFMRERYALPEDELERLEQTLSILGYMLAGDTWQTALLLLDSTHLDGPQIEAMLEAHARTLRAPDIQAPQASAIPTENDKIPAEPADTLARPARFNFPACLTAAPAPQPPPPTRGTIQLVQPQPGQPPPRKPPRAATH